MGMTNQRSPIDFRKQKPL